MTNNLTNGTSPAPTTYFSPYLSHRCYVPEKAGQSEGATVTTDEGVRPSFSVSLSVCLVSI